MGVESFRRRETEESPEERISSPAEVIAREKTFLGRFRGNAAKVLAPAFVILSAAACNGHYGETGMPSGASPGGKEAATAKTVSNKEGAASRRTAEARVRALAVARQKAIAEEAKKESAANVSGGKEAPSAEAVEKVAWAEDILNSMRRDMPQVATKEDAYFLVKKHYQQFVRGFYFEKEEYSDGQLRFLEERARELAALIRDVDARWQTDFSKFSGSQLRDIEQKAERRLRYSYKSQKEIAEEAPRIIEEYQKAAGTPKTFEEIVEEATRGK